MTTQRVPTPEEMEKSIDKLLSETRYAPPDSVKRDRHGMPKLLPEPDDPDDE